MLSNVRLISKVAGNPTNWSKTPVLLSFGMLLSFSVVSRPSTCPRPRGWHLDEPRVTVDNVPISGSLFDFALYFYHNAKELIKRGSGPYFYLPKLEHYLEARLWNDVFLFSQSYIGIPHNTIRATVLIETLPAAFQMEEILFELRNHSSGLNCGRLASCVCFSPRTCSQHHRWDYIFSFIKKRRADRTAVLPDRKDVTMTVPFMDAYVRLLIQTCHRQVFCCDYFMLISSFQAQGRCYGRHVGSNPHQERSQSKRNCYGQSPCR